ncbi:MULTISPECIES: hypothetical protein [Okeania]|nr:MULTISPECIES: hypothetical protein [Okeania]
MILGVLKTAFLIEAIANQEKSHKLSFCEAPKIAQVFCLALLK